MGAIDPQTLYQEFLNDPTAIGYGIGNGVSFNDKMAQINQIRETITVQRVASGIPPVAGEVQESLPVQLIRDTMDPDEYVLNCEPIAGEDAVIIGKRETTRDRILTFYGGSDGQSEFAFTVLSKAQILDLFTNANWPTTRANLVALQTRDGSRAEQLFGSPDAPVSRQNMLDAEAWGQANGQPTLYE